MSIQVAFFGSEGTSTITAQPAVVTSLRTSGINLAIVFGSTGLQQTIRNGSTNTLGHWVTPPITTNQWEIRAVLDSGVPPTTGDLGVWQDFSVNRQWTLSNDDPGLLETFLTFEFRKVGGTVAEFTLGGSYMSAEVVSIF